MPDHPQSPQAGPDHVGQAVAAANAALDRALVHGTPDEAASLFTADAVLGESGMADVVGRQAIAGFLARGNQVRTVTFHAVHREELIVLGTRAIEFAWFDEIKLANGGVPVRERGRVVTDWRLDSDGAWRIARLVISDLPAA
jgi:ketosteroid isomerase-like protein